MPWPIRAADWFLAQRFPKLCFIFYPFIYLSDFFSNFKFFRKNGSLLAAVVEKKMISEDNIDKISKKFGSPFFLVDEKKIKKNIGVFNKSFSNYKGRFILGYSVKTNPLVGILKIMRKFGVVSECASSIDIESSLAAGYEYSDIVYAGLFKSPDTLNNSVKNNIKLINIESFQEAETLYEICKKLNKKNKSRH